MSTLLAQEILETVPAIMWSLRQEMRRRRELGLSVPEFRALAFIWRHEGTDLSALAEHLGLSLPSASKIVQSLLKQDMVSRHEAAPDRRFVALGVTPIGRQTIQKARYAATRVLQARFASLDPASQDEMAKVLHQLGSYFIERPHTKAA